jgi:hypothetical protein
MSTIPIQSLARNEAPNALVRSIPLCAAESTSLVKQVVVSTTVKEVVRCWVVYYVTDNPKNMLTTPISCAISSALNTLITTYTKTPDPTSQNPSIFSQSYREISKKCFRMIVPAAASSVTAYGVQTAINLLDPATESAFSPFYIPLTWCAGKIAYQVFTNTLNNQEINEGMLKAIGEGLLQGSSYATYKSMLSGLSEIVIPILEQVKDKI